MKLLGPMHLSLLLLALVNMVPAIEAESSWGILAIAIAAALFSCLSYKLPRSTQIRSAITRLGVIAAVAYLIFEMFFPHLEPTVHIIDLSHFVIFLCCCKFFELQTYRDAGLIAVVSFLLMVISAFVSASPLFGVALVIDATFGIGWLIVFLTQRDMDAVLARRRTALGARAEQIKDFAPERSYGPRRYLATTAACSATLLALAALFFVTAPRGLGTGLFSRIPALAGRALTGFSRGVNLTNNDIYADDSVVMRVRFTHKCKPITDPAFQPYMRGQTFDRYYHGQWRRTPTVFANDIAPSRSGSPSPLLGSVAELDSDNAIRQDVWLESTASGVLFSLYPPLAFASQDVKRLRMDRVDLVLQTLSSPHQQLHYVAYAAARPSPAVADILRRWPAGPRDGSSLIPRRVAEFARDFAAKVGDPSDPWQFEQIAGRFRDYLASGRFEYTFHRGQSGTNGDLVANFLFDNPRGHCEYFASAMTVLCQAVGIPARLVSGYHGGEFNQTGRFYQFRQRDAHTWVEVFLPDRGWTLFDPTPAAIGPPESDNTLLAKSRRFCDYVQFKWATLVFSFDNESRAGLIRGARDWFAKVIGPSDHPASFAATVGSLLWGPALLALWQRLLYWLLLLLSAALVILVLRLGWLLSLMFRERLMTLRKPRSGLIRRPEAKFYDRLMLLLSRRGYVKADHQTPREFAQTLASAQPDLAELTDFTEWFYEVQFGHRHLGPDRQQRVAAFLRHLGEKATFVANKA